MIALTLSTPERLAVEGGDPPESLHVTLKYLGEASLWDAARRAEVESVARSWGDTVRLGAGVIAKVGGLGDEGAMVAHLDVPWLIAARDVLSRAVDVSTGGIDVSDRYPSFLPHVTLGYGIDAPEGLVGRIVEFSSVSVFWGDESTIVSRMGVVAAAGQQNRQFDEEKHKRASDGKFSTSEGPKLTTGATVTNSRSGRTGRVLGRSPSGQLIVEMPDGSRARWDPASTNPHRDIRPVPVPSKPGKGRSGGGGGGKQRLTAAFSDPNAERRAEAKERQRERRREQLEKAARRDKKRFADRLDGEIARARTAGEPPRLYTGNDYVGALLRLKESGVRTETRPDGVVVAHYPGGAIEIRRGKRPPKERIGRVSRGAVSASDQKMAGFTEAQRREWRRKAGLS